MELALRIVQLLVCLLLITIVLFQSGKRSGLSGVISGTSETYLSKNKSKSLDARLAKATKWVAASFVILTLVLNII